MKKVIENIIVVDDEQDICFLVKSILKRQTDAQIDICHSVSEAIKMLSESSYDLAFFDMRLNDGTGEDLIEFVKEKSIIKPYIAVISAYTSANDMDSLKKLEINEFIPKPLSREKIINCYHAAAV